MEKSKAELQMEIDLLRREIRTAREAAEITSALVVKQFEQTESMLYRFQKADAERQAVLDAASQLSIIATDLDGTIRLFSRGAANLLGYRSSEMVDRRNILSLHLPEELEHYGEEVSGVPDADLRDMKVFDQFVKQRHSRAQEWFYVCKDGTHLPVSLSITGLLNPHGTIIGYLFTAMGLTLQKQMELELIAAKEAAESANASKGDFLARMSHEIRTPMNGIIGMASLLQKSALSQKQHDYVDKLYGSTNTLLRLINDILDFSKIDAGKLQLENVLFNLEEVFGNIANVVGMQAEKKGLEFLFRVDPEVPASLIGDPLRLGQVLMNLAGNAVKFTDKGEVIVSVFVEKMQKDDCLLRFCVRDSGIGLHREQIDSLFSAFAQADDSITRKYGGTGLGLTICKQLVELMGGRIWAESQPGHGSQFIFTALLQTADLQTRRRRHRDQLKGVRALVVDDNEAARDVLSAMLRSFAIEVDMAADGKSAITRLRQAVRQDRPYDIVLLDWIMPGIDGIETAKRIKKDSAISKVPSMLMVTANGREEAYHEANKIGMDGFLLKPVYSSVMYNTLLEIIGIDAAEELPAVRYTDQLADLEDLNGAHILLVDDNSINQEVAAEFLLAAGIGVKIAENGLECLKALEEGDFDLVLMDIQMPEMDGLEATKRIRADKRFKNLPIIAMTAHAMTGDREKSLAAGMNDHIVKPIDQDALYQALKQWIGKRSPGASVKADRPEMSSPVEIPDLPALPGIDREKALKALNNNSRLFVKMLYDFKKNYSTLPALMRRLAKAGSWGEIEKQAHTVKGVASYIGSSALMTASRKLEEALRGNKRREVNKLLAVFIETLEHLLVSLSALPAHQSKAGRKKGATADTDDPAAAIEPLRSLIEQLKRGEAASEEQFARIRNMLAGAGIDDQLQEIAMLIDEIEYESASVSVQSLLDRLEHGERT